MTRNSTLLPAILLFFAALCGYVSHGYAQDGPPSASQFRSTDLPLPRFVSMVSDKIYVRTGPGVRYPIQWVYKKKDLPVEIILEYETWRKIRDREGEGGWVHQSLLSGKRTALTQGDQMAAIRSNPDPMSRLLAYIEPNVVASVDECRLGWCEVEASGYKGWIERKFIWGIYENENFD